MTIAALQMPHNGTHQGTPIPRPQRHNVMINIGKWWARQDSNLGRRIRRPARVSESFTYPDRVRAQIVEVASKPHKTKPPRRVTIILMPCEGEVQDMSVALNREIIVMPRSYNATQSTLWCYQHMPFSSLCTKWI